MAFSYFLQKFTFARGLDCNLHHPECPGALPSVVVWYVQITIYFTYMCMYKNYFRHEVSALVVAASDGGTEHIICTY
jgi:hypothetical protein